MTLFLASVRDAGEAEMALANGADIIDAKEPRNGALGALAPAEVLRIVDKIGNFRPVSAVLGDLPMDPSSLADAAGAMADCGLTYLKFGLFPAANAAQCLAAIAEAAPAVKKIGVMFADLGVDVALLEPLAAAEFHGVMIDTAGKGSGRLIDHMGLAALAAFMDRSHAVGLQVGLAGGLEMPDVPRLLPLRPDIIGFRRALCGSNGRAGHVTADAIKAVRDLIPPHHGVRDARMTVVANRPPDAHLLAPEAHGRACATDRIFVRDFIIPMRIGAYAYEHDQTQRVRFNVEAEVARLEHTPADMRDVVSYDVIIDGIHLIAAREHIPLVETAAERVANIVLEMPRVVRVMVRVEKLDVHPCSVGIEITREPRTQTSAGQSHHAGAVGRSAR